MSVENELKELKAQVRRLEDLEEIRRLYTDYGMNLDARDASAYAQLFSADAKLRLGPVMKGNGPAEIKQAALAMFGSAPEGARYWVHVLNSPRIELDGDRATGECIWLAVTRTDGEPTVSTGRHIDEFVRENGSWRFASRKGLLDIGALRSAKSDEPS